MGPPLSRRTSPAWAARTAAATCQVDESGDAVAHAVVGVDHQDSHRSAWGRGIEQLHLSQHGGQNGGIDPADVRSGA